MRLNRNVITSSLLLLTIVIGARSLRSQTTTGVLSGTVTDQSGGLLAGVQILVENETNGAARTVYTDAGGRYSVPNLPAGSYRVTATLPRFEALVRQGVVIPTGGSASADLTLKVGRVGTEVKVNAPLSADPTEVPTAQIDNVVNQEDYTNTQALSVSNIFALSPGVTTQQGNGPRDISISIRGSNAQQTYGVRNLQMSEDGFPVTQPDGLGRTDINDPHAYDEVDVVEGPSSALYGNYATGGHINFHQRQVQGIEFGADVGSFGYENDYLSMGSTGEQYRWTGFFSNVRGSQYTDHTNYDTFTADMLAGYSLTPKDRIVLKFIDNELVTQLSIRLSLNQYQLNPWQKGCASLAVAGCASVSLYENGFNGTKVSESADEAELGRHDRRTILGMRWDHDFTEKTTLSTQVVWDDRDINQPTSSTGVFEPVPSYNMISDLTRHGTLWGVQSTTYVALSFNYENYKEDSYNLTPMGNPLDGTVGGTTANLFGNVWNSGLRARQEFLLARKWTAVVGAGFEHTGLAATEQNYAYPSGAAPTITTIPALRVYNEFAPSGALRFQATPGLAVHGDVGTGYGTPQSSNLFVTPQGVYGNNTQLKAQTNVGTDVGVDWKPGSYLLLSAAGFYEWFHNELVTQSPGVNLQSYTYNAPASAHRGVSMIADFHPTPKVLPGVRFRVNYLFDRQSYSDFIEQLSAGNFTERFNRDGNLIPGVIPQSLNFRVVYDQPSGRARGIGGFVEDVVSQGFYLDNADLIKAPGSHVLNANLHYTPAAEKSGLLSRLTFYIEVANIVGNAYVSSASNIADSLNSATGVENGAATLATTGSIWAGPPRTIYGGLRFWLRR